MSGPTTLQSVEKTIRVLEVFLQLDRATVTLTEVAEALGWSRPATHQYLTTLVHCGWLQQDERRQYRLSIRAATFGRFATAHAGVPEAVSRTMRALVARLEEPISFAVRNGGSALIVERVEPERSLSVRREAERQLPLGSTSGQVLLAFDPHASDAERAPHAEAIAEIREHGYSVHRAVWMGDAIEVVAVPVMQGEECLGALSVIAPEGRMEITAAIDTLVSARNALESELAGPEG
ncbi:helix-turn-helix domain-containing protein [Leucobacter allii]|uniref:Helix-turn-helix domain-containing protein n=1 Tax=Leucobacter allii TaxID=2932247 RepID=A0ABY4FJ27_9MICO|nr:helix-turn-helix domain-containing protein [Leucobacter allii]UOQ55922.1 helix-turn-helix domain-containing protein [Leucobacter allii]